MELASEPSLIVATPVGQAGVAPAPTAVDVRSSVLDAMKSRHVALGSCTRLPPTRADVRWSLLV